MSAKETAATAPSSQYLIKVEENSASSHLVPLQRHLLVKEQLARKPEVRGPPNPSAPNACFLPNLCGAHPGQWEVGLRKLRSQRVGGLPTVTNKIPWLSPGDGSQCSPGRAGPLAQKAPKAGYSCSKHLPPLRSLQPPPIQPQPQARPPCGPPGAQVSPVMFLPHLYHATTIPSACLLPRRLSAAFLLPLMPCPAPQHHHPQDKSSFPAPPSPHCGSPRAQPAYFVHQPVTKGAMR